MKAFESIHNPYIVGNPIRGTKMFFGREDDFAYIQTKISGGREGGLIVLCGARRSGKTSILFQIQEGRLGPDFVPVLIDMQSMAISNDGDFLEKVARAIVASGNTTSSQIEEFEGDFRNNPFDAFESFIRRLADKLGEKKLILAFDEYELFETHFEKGVLDKQVLRMFGNLIEHKKIFVLFTGSDRLESRKRDYWDFLTKGLNRRISFLTRRDTLRLVREPVEGVVRYEDNVAETIADLTAGQPFYTQVLCQSIVDHLNEERRYNVQAEDLQQVVDAVVADPLPQMIFHWNQTSTLEKLCLSVVAELNKNETRPVSVDEVVAFMDREQIGYRAETGALNKALESLFKGDLLTKEGERYEFKMGLWRAWITRMHSVWRVIDEMERNDNIPPELTPAARSTVRRWAYAAAGLVIMLTAVYFLRGVIFDAGAGPADSPSRNSVEHVRFRIASDPSDAEVWFNGARLGWTPLIDSIPAGIHEVKLTREGYRDITDTLEMPAGLPWDTTFVLEALVGNVLVQSTPPGARVWIDGEDSGLSTPAEVTQLSASMAHEFSLALDGFNRYTFPPVEIIADSTVLISRRLARRTAPLRIRSDPVGATFDLGNGKWRGTTPFAIPGVDHGLHVLSVTAAGYQTWRGDVNVPSPGDEVFATLKRLADGYFRFMIQPVGDVYVDGTRVRSEISYGVVASRPGRRIIEIRLGDRVYNETLDLTPGDTVTVRHSFPPQ